MTLLATEIHRHESTTDAVIVFAADQRISRGGARDSEHPKIIRIPKLRAGIGYFGLAEIPRRSGRQPMAEWLQEFLGMAMASTLEDLAVELARSLNQTISDEWRLTQQSGFHLCGFAETNRPEFWYIRNVDDTLEQNPVGRYDAREDFQARDAGVLPEGAIQIYRNGDIRAHVLAWERTDDAFGGLLGTPDFRTPRTTAQYEEWVRFKMETITAFYETFSRQSIIGRPIDVFSVSV